MFKFISKSNIAKAVGGTSTRTKILGGITIASAISTGISIFLDNQTAAIDTTPVPAVAEAVELFEDDAE